MEGVTLDEDSYVKDDSRFHGQAERNDVFNDLNGIVIDSVVDSEQWSYPVGRPFQIDRGSFCFQHGLTHRGVFIPWVVGFVGFR